MSVVAIAALAISSAGIAEAGSPSEYQGKVKGQPFSRIGLDTEKRGGKRVVGKVEFDMNTQCEFARGGPQAEGYMKGFLQVRKGRFEGKRDGVAYSDPEQDDEVSVKVKGEVVSPRVIRGSIRVKEVEREGATMLGRCNTGNQEFRVEKPRR